MTSMLERYLGRPIRDTTGGHWWIWIFLLPIALWAWPFVVIYLIGRLVMDMMQYTPSETRLAALAANSDLPEIPPPVRPVDAGVFPAKADYQGPETQWWDVDDVPVGKEHGRPEDEWWDIEDVQLGSGAPTSSGNEPLIQFWGMVGLVFLLTFVLLGANGAAFTFALLSTSVLLVIFYQIGPLRSMLGNE